MQLCFSSFLIFSCYHSIISCCKMTTIPPLPSLYPSFPQLIFLLSHFPFCVWYLVFVCAVNTLENEPETFSPWCSFCTSTHTDTAYLTHCSRISTCFLCHRFANSIIATVVLPSHLSLLLSLFPSLISGFNLVCIPPSTANNRFKVGKDIYC